MIKLRKILLCNILYYFLLFLCLTYAFLYITSFNRESKYKGYENTFKLIIRDKKQDGNKITLELLGKEKLISTYYFKEEKELKHFNKYNIGDTLLINGSLKKPNKNTIPNMFNYKDYLFNHNIFYILEITKYKKIKSNNNILYFLKNKTIHKIEKFKYKEYFYTFIMGETNYIDNEVMNSYRYNGVTHLFALSGMHVGVISLILLSLLKKLKVSEIKRYLVTFLLLILLAFMANFSPSIMRASLFFLLLGINEVYYFNIKTINIFYLTFIILIFINPYYLFDLGFQLSFVVTFFLILSSKLLENKNKFSSLLIISIISFLSSFVILINNFYYVNIFSIVNNLIFVPLVSAVIFPLTLITFFIPFLEPILNVFYHLMEILTLMVNNVKIFNYTSSKFNIYFIIIYYICLILLVINNKKKYVLFLIIIIILNNYIPKLDKNTYIYFVDVGQGDSILITTPKLNKTIVIDVGGRMDYQEESWQHKNKVYKIGDTLIPFYRSLGIKKIDYLFLTHGDDDHAGEANKIINNFKVNNIFINKGELNDLEKKIIKKEIINKKTFKIDNIKLSSLNNGKYNEENDNSLVFLLEIKTKKMLLMGDAPVKVEKDLIGNKDIKNINILKVGHHGSITSSSEEFIKYTNPKTSIISVGKNNRFGHPREEVLYNLRNTNILRTDKVGTIIMKV